MVLALQGLVHDTRIGVEVAGPGGGAALLKGNIQQIETETTGVDLKTPGTTVIANDPDTLFIITNVIVRLTAFTGPLTTPADIRIDIGAAVEIGEQRLYGLDGVDVIYNLTHGSRGLIMPVLTNLNFVVTNGAVSAGAYMATIYPIGLVL